MSDSVRIGGPLTSISVEEQIAAMMAVVTAQGMPDAESAEFAAQAALSIAVSRVFELKRCDSPIEEKFLTELRRRYPATFLTFEPNLPVMGGRYRIDLADGAQKIGVELDGYEFHSSKESFVNDRKRQRELELDGWRIMRFAGAEINADVAECVEQFVAWVALIARPTNVVKLPPPNLVDASTGRARLGARLKRETFA